MKKQYDKKKKLKLEVKIEFFMIKLGGIGRMAELVDAPDSKSSSSNGVWVRFPLRPPGVNWSQNLALFCWKLLCRVSLAFIS